MAKLFIYNPTCDMAVENGTYSYMPSKLLTKFERDISPLMAFLGKKDDFVLCDQTKPIAFEAFWKQFDVELPQFIARETIEQFSIDELRPWGWSQLIKHQYRSFYSRSIFPVLDDPLKFRTFFSRQTSLQLTHELNKLPLPDFVRLPELPEAVTSIEIIKQRFKSASNGIVLKTLWSSSGRGLMFIRNLKQLENGSNWMTAQFKKHGSLILEPIYDKLQDASLQFNITPAGKIEFMGLNYFDADSSGHFSKEYLHVPDSIERHLPHNEQWLADTAEYIAVSMKNLKVHEKYHGPIGIDTMFIKDLNGQLRFYPLVEANLRCNMGLVNLHIKHLMQANSKGTWQISQFEPGEALAFYQQQLTRHPAESLEGKITKGFFPLTPVDLNTRFAAWGMVY